MLLLPKQPGSDVENIKNILTKENDCVETLYQNVKKIN